MTTPERTSYLGFPIDVGPQKICVFTPELRKLGYCTSVKKARLLVRGYRRAAKAEQ